MYRKAIPTIQARETLRNLFVVETPNLKENARRQRYDRLNEDAFPKENRILSFEDLAKQIGG